MAALIRIVLFLAFGIIGVIQVFATVDGVAYFTGWSKFASWMLALCLGWVPLLGTLTGIYGAVAAWGWSWFGAVALFTWHLALSLIFIIATSLLAQHQNKRR